MEEVGAARGSSTVTARGSSTETVRGAGWCRPVRCGRVVLAAAARGMRAAVVGGARVSCPETMRDLEWIWAREEVSSENSGSGQVRAPASNNASRERSDVPAATIPSSFFSFSIFKYQ